MREQLTKLARPFPDRFVHKSPGAGGGDYVSHHAIAQALLATVGPYNLTVKEIIRGDVDGIPAKDNKPEKPPLKNVAVGVIAALSMEIDGKWVEIEEIGDCEKPHNWKSDGQRLKDAISDAVKRCAMRCGLGLHLWAQNEYFLYDSLTKDSAGSHGAQGDPATAEPRAVETAPAEASAEDKDPGRPFGESPGPTPRKDPRIKAKRSYFEKLCKSRNLDPEGVCKEYTAGGVSLDNADMETLDALVLQVKP